VAEEKQKHTKKKKKKKKKKNMTVDGGRGLFCVIVEGFDGMRHQ